MVNEKIDTLIKIIGTILSIPIISTVAYLIGWFKNMKPEIIVLYLIIYCLIIFDIGIVFYLIHRNKEHRLFIEKEYRSFIDGEYKKFKDNFADLFFNYGEFLRQYKENNKQIDSLKQDIVVPLYTAIVNSQGIIMLDQDKDRLKNHREKYIKKYGYF